MGCAFSHAKRSCGNSPGQAYVLCLFFLSSTTVAFHRFAEIGVALQDIREGFELIRIHFRKINFEKFAVHNHLCLSGVICFFQFIKGAKHIFDRCNRIPGICIFTMSIPKVQITLKRNASSATAERLFHF